MPDKEIKPRGNRFFQRRKVGYFTFRRRRQPFYVLRIHAVPYQKKIVCPERRSDIGCKSGIGSQLFMIFKAVRRVVGRRDIPHIGHCDQLSRRIVPLFYHPVCAVVYLLRRCGRKRGLYPEIHRKLHLRPVIKRISRGIFDSLRVSEKFLIPPGIPGYVLLVNTGKPHELPLVMVSGEPHAGYVGKLPVEIYLLRRQVAVIVIDRKRPDSPVQLHSPGRAEQIVMFHLYSTCIILLRINYIPPQSKNQLRLFSFCIANPRMTWYNNPVHTA